MATAVAWELRAIRVHLDNGDSYVTSCNGTDAEILDYFLGQWLNMGDAEHDDMRRCVRVQFIN